MLGGAPRAWGADRKTLAECKGWWLKRTRGANIPNWDIASTCTVEGKRGLLLVEAKAHIKELDKNPKRPGNKENDNRIKEAIQEASDALNQIMSGWSLQRDACYQLCNRFAWAWKLASQGISVVLVYLGFLDARDMAGRYELFAEHSDWENCLREHTKLPDGKICVPTQGWGSRLDVGGTPLIALIRSLPSR